MTFGSMVSSRPQETTRKFINIFQRHKIPAIINTAGGGFVQPLEYDTNMIHITHTIPYDWILPKIYGIVHHGGSGTTQYGLRHGYATLIIPHIFDQDLWNKIIFQKKLGPKGPGISKITEVKLEPKILDLYHNTTYKENALMMSQTIKTEANPDELHRFVIREDFD